MKSLIISLLLLTANSFLLQAQNDTINATDASKYIGKEVCVKALVTNVFFAEKLKGQPTILNLEKPAPNNPMAVILYDEFIKKNKIKATEYKDKTILVKGKIEYFLFGSTRKPCIKIAQIEQIIMVE